MDKKVLKSDKLTNSINKLSDDLVMEEILGIIDDIEGYFEEIDLEDGITYELWDENEN